MGMNKVNAHLHYFYTIKVPQNIDFMCKTHALTTA